MNDDDPWEWMLPVIAMLLFTLAVASYTVTVEREEPVVQQEDCK